jgi:hypothetical protein
MFMGQWILGSWKLIIFAAGVLILSLVAVRSFAPDNSFRHSIDQVPGQIWPGIG